MTGRRTRAFVFLALAIAAGCKKDDGPTESSLFIDVVIEPPTPVLAVGAQITLKATVTGPPGIQQGVVWSAIDPDIATVNSTGVVTARAEGSGRIRAAWSLDQEIYRQVEVQVTTTPIEEDAVPPAVRRAASRQATGR